MDVIILIPTPLRPYTDNNNSVTVSGSTVEEALKSLIMKYPQLHRHLFSEDGNVRGFINVYVNDDDIRYLQQGKTPLNDTDVISIIPSIAGGIDERAVVEEVELSHDEILRYSRHLIMPEVGMEGQKKLKAASVVIVGAGGLGSPVGLYLAAAGVGRIGIVDFDVVDMSNLQRQVIHSTKNIGRSKLESARERINEINPHVEIETFETKLTSKNAMNILGSFDVIIDGTDNFPTRYLVNDACVLLGKPNVYGSIFRFEGQVSVFCAAGGDAKIGPCYRCLYATPPPPGLVPNCAEGGVLGVLPGIIGSLQALETIKLIIGRGDALIGRLLLFDALRLSFRELKLRKNPQCPMCGEHRTIHELIDYEQFCGTDSQSTTLRVEDSVEQINGLKENDYEISPQQLKARLDNGEDIFILDVREPHEYEICNLGGHLIPLATLQQHLGELNPQQEIVVHCKSGRRSAKAVEVLRNAGFQRVANLIGGIDKWASDIDPLMPRY